MRAGVSSSRRFWGRGVLQVRLLGPPIRAEEDLISAAVRRKHISKPRLKLHSSLKDTHERKCPLLNSTSPADPAVPIHGAASVSLFDFPFLPFGSLVLGQVAVDSLCPISFTYPPCLTGPPPSRRPSAPVSMAPRCAPSPRAMCVLLIFAATLLAIPGVAQVSPSQTRSQTPTPTPSRSQTPSRTASQTQSRSLTQSRTSSQESTPSQSSTPSQTATTASASLTSSQSQSVTAASATATPSQSLSFTPQSGVVFDNSANFLNSIDLTRSWPVSTTAWAGVTMFFPETDLNVREQRR